MKCKYCGKKFSYLTNHFVCPYCKKDNYKIENNININELPRVKCVIDTSNDFEEDDEISVKNKVNKPKIKVKEEDSYLNYDSYNWIESENKSKWEDFDDEDDE